MPRRPYVVFLAVAWTSLIAAPSRAQDAGDVAAARQLGTEGVQLADAGKCTEAVERLARAERLFHAPTTLARLGECQVALGKLVEGTENLRRVVRDTLPAGAPQAFVAAQTRARGVLDKATPRIARLRIVVTGAGDAPVSVKVDDQAVSSDLLGVDRPSDPGEHSVEVTAHGFLAARSKVTLKEGGAEVVTLTLSPDPNATKPTAPDAGKPPTTPAPVAPDATKRNYVPAFVALGVGGVGLAVGAIFGGLAMGARGSLVDACNANQVCPPSAQPTYDRAVTFSTVSTIGFIGGGVGVAAALVLFFVAPSKNVQSASIMPIVGPGAVGLGGRF
jgi:hypothetical protein